MQTIDYALIDNIVIEGIDGDDYPDFCDAFIASADYAGKPMKEEMIEALNKDSDFLYQQVLNFIH
jgi:hypothetical protein